MLFQEAKSDKLLLLAYCFLLKLLPLLGRTNRTGRKNAGHTKRRSLNRNRLFCFYSLDSLVVSKENLRIPRFTPKVSLRIFSGKLSAKTSFIAACIFPSVSLFGKIPCSLASSFTLSMVLANLRSLVNVSMMAMVVAVAIGDFNIVASI